MSGIQFLCRSSFYGLKNGEKSKTWHKGQMIYKPYNVLVLKWSHDNVHEKHFEKEKFNYNPIQTCQLLVCSGLMYRSSDCTTWAAAVEDKVCCSDLACCSKTELLLEFFKNWYDLQSKNRIKKNTSIEENN